MTATPAFVDIDPTKPIQMTPNAWKALEAFSPAATNELLKSTCAQGLWASLDNAIMAGCPHGEQCANRLETIMAAIIKAPEAAAVARRWLQELSLGAYAREEQFRPTEFLHNMKTRALTAAAGATGPGAHEAVAALLDKGAIPNAGTFRAALEQGADQAFKLLLREPTGEQLSGEIGSSDPLRSLDDYAAGDLLTRACKQAATYPSAYFCAKDLANALAANRPLVLRTVGRNLCTIITGLIDTDVGAPALAAVWLAVAKDVPGAQQELPEHVAALIQNEFPYRLVKTDLLPEIYAGALEALVHFGHWDIDARSVSQGLTLLQVAAQNGKLELVRAALARKPTASIDQHTPTGTARDLALKEGHAEIAQLLAAYSARQALQAIGKRSLADGVPLG